MKLWIARDRRGSRLTLHGEEPVWNEEYRVWARWYMTDLDHDSFPEVTFENSPSEVEIIEKSTLDEVYKGLDQYENFLGMVACMRRAQKEANDMIAQVECYEEAMEHVKKAEELESMVDKWLEGEAL